MPNFPRCNSLMDADEGACPQCGRRLKEEIVYRHDYSRQELLDLGLSPKFVEFVFLDPKPAAFHYRCESRHSGWACFVPNDVSGVYPLWTSSSDVTALWMRRGRIEFVWLYHDDPEATVLAQTEQGLLLVLFLALAEADDWTDPAQSLWRLQELAEIAGFHYLSELIEWHDRNGGAADFREQWERLVASVDARCGRG